MRLECDRPAGRCCAAMVRKVGTARIVREIGRGGMGVVYEGFQEGLDRPVAVKAPPDAVSQLSIPTGVLSVSV